MPGPGSIRRWCSSTVIPAIRRLADAFDAVRIEILSKQRDLTALRKDIREMRHKMSSNLGTKSTSGGLDPKSWTATSGFHIKHDYGGIVDIEFIVQFAVLAWSTSQSGADPLERQHPHS